MSDASPAGDDAEVGRSVTVESPLRISPHRAEVSALVVVVVVALLVRLFTRTSLLPPAVNADEYAWAWAGQSIILEQTPTSWSYLIKPSTCPCLQDPMSGSELPAVHGWVDHPPLFALLVGAVAVAAGETAVAAVTPGVIRVVPDVLSVLTLLLGYLLARRVAGRDAALLFALLFALAPTMVLAGSLVEAEWLLAPMLLAVLLLREHRGRAPTAALLVICVTAPLVKETGVLVAGSLAVVQLVDGARWRALGTAAAGAFGAALVVGWGWLVSWPHFLTVLGAQAGRHGQPGGSPLGGFLLDLRAGYGGFLAFHDPLWYLGLGAVAISAMVMAFRRRWSLATLCVPVAVTTVLMALSAPGSAVFNGWYRLSIYPLAYIALAWGTVAAIRLTRAVAVR